jgi:hypothetical protein
LAFDESLHVGGFVPNHATAKAAPFWAFTAPPHISKCGHGAAAQFGHFGISQQVASG